MKLKSGHLELRFSVVDFFLLSTGVCKGRLQTVECANPNHDSSDLHECKVHSDSFSLISVRLTEELDDTSCTFYDGPHEDVSADQSRWGFTSDAIWVKGYCHGNFEYCSTGTA